MKSTSFLSVAAALAVGLGGTAAADDCVELSVTVRHAIEAKESSVLEVIEKQIAANPGCACEIVKAAIEATKAGPELVSAIVETAATTAPEHMRLIAQCAMAVAPDALSEVQAVMIRLEPSSGETTHTAKSGKTPKTPVEVKPAWNPLDFPGEGVGPSPGTWIPDSPIPVPPVPPSVNPPAVVPPVGTPTDFGSSSGSPYLLRPVFSVPSA